MKMRGGAILMALLMAGLIAGCGGSGGSGGGGEADRVGVVLKALDNPFFVAMQDGAEAMAGDLGVKANIQAAPGAEDTSGQASALESLVGQDYPCYLVNPISGTNLVQPLAQATQQGASIVNIDSPLSEEAVNSANIEVATYIGSDNVAAGRSAGEHMLGLLDKGDQVALLNGISGNVTGEDRLRGFEGAVEGDLEIVQRTPADFDREEALTVATDILRANPDLDGFFAANDLMALGAVTAVRNAGKEEGVEIIGVDGIEAALAAIERGELSATVSQYPYAMGSMGLEACVAAAQGDDLPARVDAPIKLITQDNVADAQENFPQPFFDYKNPFSKLVEEG